MSTRTDARWWITLLAGSLLPAATLLPLMQLGSTLLPASKLLPQAFSNEVVVWALGNAVLVLLLGLIPGGVRPAAVAHAGRAVVLALLTAAAGYAVVALVAACLLVDLRYWFIAFRPMTPGQFPVFMAYLVPFALFFFVVLRALHASLGVRGHSPLMQYLVNVSALAGGMAVFLAIQYGLLFGTGRMLDIFMNDALRTVIAINFVPLMAMVAVIATFAWRRTGSHVTGAAISALLVAWYVVVGQATQVG